MSDARLLAVDAAARDRALDTQAQLHRPRPGRLRQDGAADPARARAAGDRRRSRGSRRDHVHAQGGGRNAAAPGGGAGRREGRRARSSRTSSCTYRLAVAVRRRDEERGWDIVHNPGRLRVQTIDALAQWLARQLPLSLGLGAAPNVTEQRRRPVRRGRTLDARRAREPDREDRAARAARRARCSSISTTTSSAQSPGLFDARPARPVAAPPGRTRTRTNSKPRSQRACERQMQRARELLPARARRRTDRAGAVRGRQARRRLSAMRRPRPACREAADRRASMRGAASPRCCSPGEDTWRAQFTKREGFPGGRHGREKAPEQAVPGPHRCA